MTGIKWATSGHGRVTRALPAIGVDLRATTYPLPSLQETLHGEKQVLIALALVALTY